MPWTTPTLNEVRVMLRDDIVAAFSGGVVIGNSVLRVISDATAGLGHLTLRYIDWLARQFLPDTAETEWLDRHGNIWLVNSDGSTGRKFATVASGTVTMTGTNGIIVPVATPMQSSIGIIYETIEQITLGSVPTSVKVRAVDAGSQGNMISGDTMEITQSIAEVDNTVTVVSIDGGTDDEKDEDLRARVLARIRQPPMGGDSSDYEIWTEAVAGVTRAWVAPLEMGMGTISIRFMMDDLRASNGGFPTVTDLETVQTYIDKVRPVAIKDRWVLSPIPEPIDFTITELSSDTVAIRSAINESVRQMLRERAAPAHAVNGVMQPAQTIYKAWVSDAIAEVPGVDHFNLTMEDHEMPTNGSIGVLGTVVYG